MGLETAVSKAARFLNLPEEDDPRAVRDALRAFIGEAEATIRNENGKANRLRIEAARRARANCEPWLAGVELAADIADYARRRGEGGDAVRLKFDQQKLAARLAALPAGDEREFLALQLEQAEPKPAEPPPAAAPPAAAAPEPPAPPAPPPIDLAQTALTEKLAELEAALTAGGAGKLRLTGLLDAARALASILRDPVAKAKAQSALTAMASRVADAIAAAPQTRPPFDPTAKALGHKLAELHTALEQKNATRASVLLETARALCAELADEALRKQIEPELVAAATQLAALLAPLAPDPSEVACAGKLNELRQALDRREIAAAMAAVREAEASLTAVAPAARRNEFTSELLALKERLRQALPPPAPPPPPVPAHPVAAAPVTATILPAATAPVRPPATGSVLTLTPRQDGGFTGPMLATLQFVARPKFVIGREPSAGPARADFLVPKSFTHVSRAHVTFSRRGEDILVKDGDDKGPSVNGTTLDEQPLSAEPTATKFDRDRVLVIGQVYPVRARHIPANAPAGPPLDPAAAAALDGRTVVLQPVVGAMRFTPQDNTSLPRVAVWLFTDATVGSGPDCAIPMPQAGLADEHARIHAWQGSFWIESLRSGKAVRVGDQALAKGQAVPLHPGDPVHLGHLSFDVALEN